jgi:hypothetical protein
MNHDIGSAFGEHLRNTLPNAAIRTRHQRNLSIHSQFHLSPRRFFWF